MAETVELVAAQLLAADLLNRGVTLSMIVEQPEADVQEWVRDAVRVALLIHNKME